MCIASAVSRDLCLRELSERCDRCRGPTSACVAVCACPECRDVWTSFGVGQRCVICGPKAERVVVGGGVC